MSGGQNLRLSGSLDNGPSNVATPGQCLSPRPTKDAILNGRTHTNIPSNRKISTEMKGQLVVED